MDHATASVLSVTKCLWMDSHTIHALTATTNRHQMSKCALATPPTPCKGGNVSQCFQCVRPVPPAIVMACGQSSSEISTNYGQNAYVDILTVQWEVLRRIPLYCQKIGNLQTREALMLISHLQNPLRLLCVFKSVALLSYPEKLRY